MFYEPEYDGKYVSYPSYDRWLQGAVRSILEGRATEVELQTGGMSNVCFIGDEPIGGAEPEYVNAFSSFVKLYFGEKGESKTVYTDPVLHIPYDTAVKAQNRLYDLIEEHGPGMEQRSDVVFFDCEGYCGDNWFILQSEELLNVAQRIHTVWRRDESGNWYEFGSNNSELAQITGACILSEKTGFMCCYSFGYEEGRACRLFATFDGGETWQNMDLTLPEEYSGYYSFHLSGPVFEDEKGAVLVSITYHNEGMDYSVRWGCFTTEDGGHSWQFMALDAWED
ncbi:MAG: hypothetical protein J6P98_03870 [Clostridia bacterium]|nr:hypothetical protein [Clostridia bacterium]